MWFVIVICLCVCSVVAFRLIVHVVWFGSVVCCV